MKNELFRIWATSVTFIIATAASVGVTGNLWQSPVCLIVGVTFMCLLEYVKGNDDDDDNDNGLLKA